MEFHPTDHSTKNKTDRKYWALALHSIAADKVSIDNKVIIKIHVSLEYRYLIFIKSHINNNAIEYNYQL